jgi:hypothetical protein
MANSSREERFREAVEMLRVPPEGSSLEERSAFLLRVSLMEPSLRVAYNRHQKSDCKGKCEYCKAIEGVFAWVSKVCNPAAALICVLVSTWHSLGWKT